MRLCSVHGPADRTHFLSHGTLLEYPVEFHSKIGCDATRFQKGLVYTTLSPLIDTPTYMQATGLSVFSHPELFKTCHIRFTTEHVHYCETETSCITRVFSLEWQDDGDFESFLGQLECKLKVSPASWRSFTKEEYHYAAVPHSEIGRLTAYIKQRLTAIDAKFHHTVAFGSTTYRCLLVPLPHLNTTLLPPAFVPTLWVLWKMRPGMHLHSLSDVASKEFGPPPPNASLETLLQQWFGPDELERLRDQVLPVLRDLQDETECEMHFRNGIKYRVHCVAMHTMLLTVFLRV
jgi:hypothetical protein